MEFETEVDIDNQDKKYETKGTIKWSLDFECRSWGVKSFYISIPEQKIDVSYTKEVFNAEEDDFDYEDVDEVLEIKNCTYDLKVNDTGEVICPQTLLVLDGEFELQF